MTLMDMMSLAGSSVVFGIMWNLEDVVPLLPLPYSSPASVNVAQNISWWFAVGAIVGLPLVASRTNTIFLSYDQ